MKKLIRKILYSNKITEYICKERIRVHEWFIYAFPYYKQKILNPNSVFLILTPEHDNIGDHAIALSEINLLDKLNIKFIEITGKKLSVLQQEGFLSIMNGSTILFNGGGNLGTLWFNVEKITRDVIEQNPKSKIIILPNTIFYEDSKWGKEELEKSVKIYNKHPNLTLYAREETSFNMMNKLYRNVKLVPDIVLSLDYKNNDCNRKGCLICLRNDREKTLEKDTENKIYSFANNQFQRNIKKTDMCVDYDVLPCDRKKEVMNKLNQFSQSELVITDRLHAMIFCAISGTPCIVVNSKSPKVKGCYEWIKNLEYIKFADDIGDIETLYKSIPRNYFEYNIDMLMNKYNELINDLKTLG